MVCRMTISRRDCSYSRVGIRPATMFLQTTHRAPVAGPVRSPRRSSWAVQVTRLPCALRQMGRGLCLCGLLSVPCPVSAQEPADVVVQAPRLLNQVAPRYPQSAPAGAHGDVSVRVTVNAQGQVVGAQALSGPEVFYAAAESAALQLRWRNGALGTMAVTMLTYPKNLEGSITLLGETGTVKIGGPAVNQIEHWAFADERPDDAEVEQASYQTTSVYGFGHPAYYANVLDALQGQGGRPVRWPRGSAQPGAADRRLPLSTGWAYGAPAAGVLSLRQADEAVDHRQNKTPSGSRTSWCAGAAERDAC